MLRWSDVFLRNAAHEVKMLSDLLFQGFYSSRSYEGWENYVRLMIRWTETIEFRHKSLKSHSNNLFDRTERQSSHFHVRNWVFIPWYWNIQNTDTCQSSGNKRQKEDNGRQEGISKTQQWSKLQKSSPESSCGTHATFSLFPLCLLPWSCCPNGPHNTRDTETDVTSLFCVQPKLMLDKSRSQIPGCECLKCHIREHWKVKRRWQTGRETRRWAVLASLWRREKWLHDCI